MRLHFVTIPVFESAPVEAELSRFLAGHRVTDGMRRRRPAVDACARPG